MKKSEISKAPDNELIADCIHTYARACLNENYRLPTKALNTHLNDLTKEMLKRGLLTEQQIANLNS